MDTSAAGEGPSFTFRIKQEPGQCEPVANEDDNGRTIRKVTVLDPLKLKLLSRQNHHSLLSGLNAAKVKAKPPAPTPPPSVPTTSASTTTATATDGELPSSSTIADPEPVTEQPAEPPPLATQPTPPTVVKAPGPGGGSSLFRRKKVVPAVIAKKIAQKVKAKPAPQVEATKEDAAPATTTTDESDPPAAQVEENTCNETQFAASASSVVVKKETTEEEVRPTAFRRIKPKVAICLNPSRPKKSILKKNSSSDLLSGSRERSKSFSDLIPEETIVLEDDDDENEVDRIEQQHAKEDEEQKRKQHEEEQRIRVEEERRNKHIEERKAAEEKRRIEEEEEQRKQTEKRQRIEEEERQRMKEEGKKVAEERRRIEAEEEIRRMEERRRIVEEAKAKAAEQRRIEEAENRRRIEEEEKKQIEENARREAEDRSKVEVSRKSRKIPAEVWKRQMEKMRTNPNRMHSAVIGSCSSQPPMGSKDSVTVEKSDVPNAKEPVSVKAPVVAQQKPKQVVISAGQLTPAPVKEIRRICPLPPSVAQQLMKSVAFNSELSKPQEHVNPNPPNESNPAPVVASESSAVLGIIQTKAIRRISRLPPNLANVVFSAVKQSTAQENNIDKEEPMFPAAVPGKVSNEVEKIEKTELPAPGMKTIKRIARLPPDIAKKLLSSVNKKIAMTESTAIKPEANKQAPETTPLTPKPCQLPAEALTVPTVTPVQEVAPQKEIRRISQLPRNVAMKLVDSLKQKGIRVPKLVLEKETVLSATKSITPGECQLSSEPTTPSSIASVPEIKVEPHEPSTKTRQKVEILSQVILPTASYNLEELLAGKSTDGMNTGPSGGVPLPLPMPRVRIPEVVVPVTPIPDPIHDLQMIDDDVGSEVTVTTEKDPDTVESLHATSDNYIVPDSENTPVQYDSHPKNILQLHEARNQTVQQSFISGGKVPTSQQHAVSYTTSSPHPVYQQSIQSPVVIQQPTSTHSGQPSITYYAKNPNSQPTSQPTPGPCRQHITIIARSAMNTSRMMNHHRMVLNPACVEQSPTQGPRHRFAATQYVLVRNPAPIRGRTVPQFPTQVQHQQQQSRQHLMVPKATYYHRYPTNVQNQHQIIYPTPRFMLSQQSQIPSHPQPMQRPQFNYAFPTTSGQNKAFRPVDPAQNFSHAQQSQPPCVIPKIVIDSSYVEQQDRSLPSIPRSPLHEQPKPVLQNSSPCSEEIRNKLRDKVRTRMLRQKGQSESPSLETPPSPPHPPPSASAPMATQPTVPRPVPASELRIQSIQNPKTQVYLPKDFPQPRMQLARVSQPAPKPADHRVIKQYICQGRKIYLTKISVTKPPQSAHSRPHVQQYQWDTGFHGFPQAVIKNDQRIFQQFSETVQQLERKISPEPPLEGMENPHVQNVRGRMKSRKPSVVTAVTTGLEGETFIITELIDPPEVAQEEQIAESTKDVPVKLPPRITTRRKTFVVDDSDVEFRAEQLPCVGTTVQEEDQGKEFSEVKVKVKVENEEREKSAEGRSAFVQRMQEEEFHDSDTSQADEDLARDILALVEKERESLRLDLPAKKIKKRIKRKKRRKKKKDGNKEMMDLLMKHVNQESLIADIVATQRKQLPVIELSDTDEDSVGKTQHVVHIKKESDSASPTELMRSTESELEIDTNESETDIFAEILKPFVDMNKEDEEEEKREDTAKTVTAEPQEGCQQEEENLETLGPQREDCRSEREEPEILTSELVEEDNRKTESSVTEEPQKDEGQQEKELETSGVKTAVPQKEDTPVEQPINVPSLTNETTAIQEISAATATDPNPVIELNQPTKKCDQTCDTSCALPLEKPKPKKALAPRAPKRRLKPMLIARSKIRKVEPLPPVQIEVECADADDIEDYSDPFSDRDEPLAAAVEEAEPQEANPNEAADSLKPSCVRELVNEWDSDEATRDLTQPTTIRPFGKHVSFDNNGNMPCRISKNNALKRTAVLNDQEVESAAIEKPIEEPVQLPQEVPVPVSTEVKSVRVSVRKTDLIERQKTPEPVAIQIEECATNTRVESTQQSVLNLLKDWEDSPVKQRIEQPKVVARVPLDRINSDELASLKNNVQPAAVQIETPDKPKEVSVDRESSIVLENIALNDQNRWDEPSASEPERIIGRIIYDKEVYEKVPCVPKDSSTELDDSMSFAAITSSRQTRSHKKMNIAPNVSKSPPTTRSSLSKQTSIKSWLSSTTTDSPSQEPVIVQQKTVPKAKRKAAEKVAETQKPAGRTLRSRTKSVFAEKAPMVEKPAPAPDSTETKVAEATSESQTEVMKEAGGAASVARNAEEQESKECSTPKPAPIVRNRIPIQISSEDEDDAPLAKRRKVLRKRRYMMRQRDRVRNLSANRRLFRGGTAHRGTLIADGNYLGETTFIKTEPVEVTDTPEYYAAPHESFTVINPEAGTEQLLSVVTVQNNQIVHAENYDVGTPPRKQYLSKDLVQSTEPTATSTPIPALATAPAEEHVFATPEPVRIAKRKRRTRQELEADRQAKQQKKDEDAIEQTRQQEIKARTKRDSKPYVPISPETVDPTIQEFQCATCSESVPRDMWDGHYAKHAGLTYRVNVDPVIDLYDETTATAIVTRFMKVHRQVTIHCDKCNVAKKSAVGLVSHRLICGLTKQEIEASKVTCEHCNRKLMAVSMNCHLSAHCPVLKKKKMEQALDLAKIKSEEAGSDVDPTMLTQRGTIKRKATAKAEKRIQNLSYSELILSVSKDKVTDGCLALWKTQFRKAKTALCVFQKCDFTGNDEMEMRHHHEFCPSPNELFECKNCKFQTEQIEQMAKHIKQKHASVLAIITAADSSGTDANITSESSEDEGTSGVDENEEPSSAAACVTEKPKKAKPKTLKSLLKSNNRLGNCTRDQFNEESDVYREMVLDELIQLRSLKSDFHLTARDWTAEFRVENYSRIALFRDLRPDVDVRFLTFNMVQEYIPKRVKSLRFILRSTNLYNAPALAQEYTEKWQHLEAFTGQVNGKESMFYCGGPIVALDWLPVPDGNDEHQILAVACKNDFEEFYLADRIYPTKCLVQIWDVGYLSNSNLYNKKVEHSAPALLYSIACNFGPIWSLKFCPSGCYNSKDEGNEYERLGLLAAAGSDGNVHIFSLGRNYDHMISNSYRVVNLTPVLKLTLSLDSDSSCPQHECHSAVKLSWSKSKNHAIIAAGYSNGAVAVWNVNSTSSLLMGTKDGVRALLPVHKAFIPDSCITAVDLHYTDHTRYLLVCNADRKVVVFDLSTGYVPVEVCSVNARSKVTTACWNTHFPLITMAFDDVYAIDRCALTFHQTREIGLRLHPLYTFTAEATDMSSSDHLSTHVIGTDGGDVLCHQPMAYIHHMGQKNTQLMKYVLTSTISVKVNDELTDNSYSMFYNNYGLLFSDSDKNSARMDLRSLQVKSFRRALLHEYPGIRINQVQWNPNERSHQYYAIGYQAGFVRVRSFRFK